MFVSVFQLELHAGQDVVVYDQNSSDPNHLGPESFLNIVLLKLERIFTTVHLLSGQSRVQDCPLSGQLQSHVLVFWCRSESPFNLTVMSQSSPVSRPILPAGSELLSGFLGGFLEFSQLFPGLCEGKSFLVPSCISQPCLPITSMGPTRILPHLYLGCQRDVLNQVTQTPRV